LRAVERYGTFEEQSRYLKMPTFFSVEDIGHRVWNSPSLQPFYEFIIGCRKTAYIDTNVVINDVHPRFVGSTGGNKRKRFIKREGRHSESGVRF